jgi:Holliday junction resolvase
MDYLRAKGYAVMRSAKSHGPADLLAGKPVEPRPGSKVLAVQVKGGSAAFTQEDARALAGFAAAFNAVPVLCGRFGKWWLVVPTGAEGLTTTFGLKPLEDWWF